MKCDELEAYKGDVYIPVYGSIADADVYLKKKVDAILAEKDKEIAELKDALERDFIAKKSAEKVLCDLMDCGLIKEWFYNGTFHAVLKADDPHLEIAELKQKLEDVNELIKTARQMLENAKASHYAESVDAGMRERRLRRAFYKACANWADYKSCAMTMAGWPAEKWYEMERKCLAKAEEYK